MSFLIGLFIGMFLGVVVMALMVMAKNSDR
jgi:hypothetical protein